MALGLRRDGIAIALVCAGVAAAGPARASEGMFSRVYTADLTPAGHVEIEQVVRERAGRVFAHYDATDLHTEVEHGVTDNFQAALYVNTNRMHATRTSDDDDDNADTGFTRHNVTLESISTEFVYRALSPYKSRHGWGLALYLEPEYAFHDLQNGLRYAPGTFSLEGRAIVQKDFAQDRLIVAYNLVLEAESVRFAGRPDTNSELDWNNELGVTYRVAPRVFVGGEFRNHNGYGNFTHHEHSVYWAGPVVHYANQHLWATLGLLRQFVAVLSKTVHSWRAPDGGRLFVDQVLGKHEMITLALALDAGGAVRGLEILDYRESYGGQVRNPAWRRQFTGKRDGAPLRLDRHIHGISGGTLSARHVTEGVRRLLATNGIVFAG